MYNVQSCYNNILLCYCEKGWNSWNKFGCDVSETLIKETIDAIVNLGLDKFGYNYVNVDDCWQAQERDSNGQVVADPTRFPNGMKYLAEYAHSKGIMCLICVQH